MLRGLGVGAGGLVIGGAAGYLGGHSSSPKSSTSGGAKGKSLFIGAGVPVTGAYSADGQDQLRGIEVAISEINARGGVLGRPLKLLTLDTQEQQSDVMETVFRKFVAQGVAAVISPYVTYSSVEFPILADAGIPMFHINTWHGNADYVKQHGITNIFQCNTTELWFAPGVTRTVQELVSKNLWKPSPKRSAAIITSNDPYSLSIANGFKSSITKLGWNVTMFQQFTVPQTDWTATMVNIRNNPPDIIFFSDYAAGDEAAFIKQFRKSPTPSLVYQQLSPGTPAYLELTGSAANGVLWSTMQGVPQNFIAKDFDAAYEKQFSTSPGISMANPEFDQVNIWATAAAEAGDPYDFKRVTSIIKKSVFHGLCGGYCFPDDTLTLYPYPEYWTDPALGELHFTYQIQNGKQVVIGPDPYTTGTFQLPDWIGA
jgi:branched-chain amino acid transport system substrate-binding protein